jgi:hypothetical protein
MRITARGWKRDSGPTVIMNYDLSEAQADVGLYYPDILYLDHTEKGVDLRVGPVPLTLGGKYQVEVQLTREDITDLFLAINPEFSKDIEGVFAVRKQKLNRELHAAAASA